MHNSVLDILSASTNTLYEIIVEAKLFLMINLKAVKLSQNTTVINALVMQDY